MSIAHYVKIVAELFPDAQLEASERLTGGVSADVHRLDLKLEGGGGTSVLLRAHGASHSGHPAELEHRLLQALHRSGLPVPEPLMLDVSGTLLPDPFLVMEFIEGTSVIPTGQEPDYIDLMAETLLKIHESPTSGLPLLPARDNPLPELLGYLPEGAEWGSLRAHLRSRVSADYLEPRKLLHGDFWPENLLWRNGAVAAILDWEDAAFGDPLSDLATARVELRYRFGITAMERFTEAYASHRGVDRERLALWQVYVAAAAQKFMGEWGLAPELETHMRKEALASIREAGEELMSQTEL